MNSQEISEALSWLYQYGGIQLFLVMLQIKYSMGGTENLEMARSYFAQACKLNPNNMRAQLGLLLVSMVCKYLVL